MTIGERPKNLTAGQVLPDEPEEDEDKEEGESVLGVSLSELDEETRETLGLKDSEKGLIVNSVERSSPFASVVTTGFALLEVNDQPMETVEDLERVIDAARRAGKERVLVTVRSARGTNFATVDISEDE